MTGMTSDSLLAMTVVVIPSTLVQWAVRLKMDIKAMPIRRVQGNQGACRVVVVKGWMPVKSMPVMTQTT